MPHDLKECSQCGTRFANEFKKLEHICPSKSSDNQMRVFLKGVEEEKFKVFMQNQMEKIPGKEKK